MTSDRSAGETAPTTHHLRGAFIKGNRASRYLDLLALVVLVSGVSLFHIRGLLPGRAFLPVDLARNNLPWRSSFPEPLQNPLISDPLFQFYPFLVNAVNTVRDGGSWPLWNPRILLGQPVVGDPLAQPFYPVFLALGLAVGPARGLTIGLWLHAILAAVLMYGFLRTVECRRHAAVAGAFTYALSGYMVTWFETTFWVSTLAWLPGVLWAFELATRRRSLSWAAIGGLVMTCAILGGQVSFAVTFVLLLGLYAMGRTLELVRRGDRKPGWPLVVATLVILVAALLSSVQTVPFSEFMSLSHRAFAGRLSDPLPMRQLITLIVPDFYGNPASTDSYWGWLNFSEGTIYAGLPALFFACLAPFCARRSYVVLLCLIAGVVSYFIVGGPGVQLLGQLPLLEQLSLHRSAFILPLLVSLLSAMALSQRRVSIAAVLLVACVLAAIVVSAMQLNLSQVRDHWTEVRGGIALAASLLSVTVCLLVLRGFSRVAFPWVDWGLVGLVLADLLLFGSQFNPVGPIAKLMPPRAVSEYLRTNVGLHRVVAYQRDHVLFGPNVLSTYGIAEASGYSSLVIARYRQMTLAGDPKVEYSWAGQNVNMVSFSHPSRRLLDLLGVSHVVSPVPLDDPGVRVELFADGCDGDSGEIAGSQAVGGTFVVRDTAINRLDLRFRVYSEGARQDALLIRMWRGAGRERLILEARQDAGELKNEQTLTLYFEPETEAPGVSYVWEVRAADGTSRTGVGLCTLSDGQPSASVYGVDWRQAFRGRVYVFERLAPMPRAYVVYGAEHIADDYEAVGRLLDEAFDLRNVAVVADPVPLPAQPEVTTSRAEIVEYRDTRVVVKGSAVQTGLLVLGDQYYPGWRAYVDGQPTNLVRVNHICRGVVLPAGEHEVVFEFAPASLRMGICLSLVGALALTAIIVLERVYRMPPWA